MSEPFITPLSLKELIIHLGRFPDVLISRFGYPSESRLFIRYDRDGLWFSRDDRAAPAYLIVNINTVHVGDGLDFDAAGFTLTKYGIVIRVTYATDQPE